MKYLCLLSSFLLSSFLTSAKVKIVYAAADFVYTWDKKTQLLAAVDSLRGRTVAQLLIDDLSDANSELKANAVVAVSTEAQLSEAAAKTKCYDGEENWYLSIRLGAIYQYELYLIHFDKQAQVLRKQRLKFPVRTDRPTPGNGITSAASFIHPPYLFRGFVCSDYGLLTISELSDPERILQTHQISRDAPIGINHGGLYDVVLNRSKPKPPSPVRSKTDLKMARKFLQQSSRNRLSIWVQQVAPSTYRLKIGAFIQQYQVGGEVIDRLLFFNTFLQSPKWERLPEEEATEFMQQGL
ncbi:MAG: hypothetical protein AAFR05_22515 [Bacteroidota bacterium]